MKINLLITGGLGYIGSFTAKNIFTRNKKKTYIVDNLSRGNTFAKKYSSSKILNISEKKTQDFIKNKKINTILHLAALTCVRESIYNKDKYYKSFKSQIKFIKSLKKTDVRYFIFSSSLSVFEGSKIKKNLSPYSNYKLRVEKYLKKISSKNFKVIVIRYPNIIGSDPSGKLGEKNNFISRIVPFFYKNILAKKKSLLFYDFKKRKFPQRSYMHVNDIAKINIEVINNFKRFNKNFYIFNVSNRKQYSNFQVLEELSKLMNVNPKYEIKQISKKESITQIYKSGDDISKYIDYKPKHLNLKKILKSNLKWFKKIY